MIQYFQESPLTSHVCYMVAVMTSTADERALESAGCILPLPTIIPKHLSGLIPDNMKLDTAVWDATAPYLARVMLRFYF